ncbi:glycerol-3-phosphate dehydrogenase [Aurantimicrobium minutum]|uniref:glycerol-3-phosphate dehydrogenase/oxidase n=1 Tax=Aurantimicrobium minutum TaxID=708131 RepID=UPI0024762CF6|nr:glycerol-3-phosphate dehydrogenase/oxidase [Aurantimicrobium minutum]MDH6532353.1 glycerol-3-phosphate dehydrogenase [Aurantimicrobium minutum]
MSSAAASQGVLNAATRAEALAALRATATSSEELDVLIIGGGIVGAGCALDAATRGLNVGVVEAQDWASGTSSRSSKLVHGGIRYLEQLDFHLVREALTERGLLLQQLAPHLVKPIRFLYPVEHPVWERAYIGAGMLLYDALSYAGGRRPGVGHHRHLSKRQIGLAAPSLRSSGIIGGMSYFDGRVDDARYVVNLVRTAVANGAHAANRTEVVGFLQEQGRVVGVTLKDLQTGEEFKVLAKQVINSTGVWTGKTQELVHDGGTLRVRASKGIHIVVPREKFKSVMGLLLRTEKSVLFVIPWGRHWIIGTTDTDWHYDKAHPSATATDIQYLLDHVNSVLDEPITHDDIEGVYVGLRPLLAGDSESTAKLSREHVVVKPKPGLVLIAGGKWTTYRVMATDAVDAAVEELNAIVGEGSIPPSVTASIPLLGASGYKAAWNRRTRTAAKAGLPRAVVEHLLNRYGSMADDLLELIAADPSQAEPLPNNPDYLRAEVTYAVTHEGALHVEDVLARRTRYNIETRDRGIEASVVVAKIMGGLLGWSAAEEKAEARNYRLSVEAEFAAEQQSTDDAANAIRTAVPSITEVPPQ